MSTRNHPRLPALAGLFAALALCAAPARAEIDVDVLAGIHLFNPDSRLSRGALPGGEAYLPNSALHPVSGIFGLRLAYLPIPRLGVEGEIGFSPTETVRNIYPMANPANPSQPLGRDFSQYPVTVIPIRAHIIFHLMTGRLRPFILAGGGVHIGSPFGKGPLQTDVAGVIHAGAGLKLDVGKDWGLRLDGRIVLPPGFDHALTAEGEVLGSIFARFDVLRPVPKPTVVDSDGDGVVNSEDRCPNQVGPSFNGGCPDKDSDGDSVVDRLDKCPLAPGPAENGGCADQDSDGDGIVDRLDKCPSIAGIKETAGCPDKDGDGDGVVDRLDKCPNEAGVVATEGCPDPDRDGDGVVDRLDRCPEQAETRNNYQDDDGCPDEVPQAVQRFTGAIQGINFQTGQAVITRGSFTVLDQAVAVLKEHAFVRLEISGHTDGSGDREKNTALSQARAEAVKKYFVDKGIAEGRLKAIGYGPDKPLGDNNTKAGRDKNRRVEFALSK